MNLIWHIIKKDIRRDQRDLLLWVLLFVGQVAVGVMARQPGELDSDRGAYLQMASVFLVILQMIIGYVLVARLVQADALIGTSSFWPTRPISPVRLFAAKALGSLLIFGLLPVALLTPWWLWCGFTVRDLFWTAVDTFGWQLLMIAPAFLIASLTDDLGRVLLWTLLLFVAGMLWTALFGAMAIRVDDGEKAGLAGVAYTRVWLSAILLVLFPAGIAAHHYLTRRLARSIGLTIAGAGVVTAAGLFAQQDWSNGLAGLTEPKSSPEVAAALTVVKVEAGAGMPDNRAKPRAGQESPVLTEIYFQGLPDNVAVASARSRQTWRWNDRLSVTRWGYFGSGSLPSERLLRETYALVEPERDPETVAWAKAQGEEKLAQRKAHGLPAPLQWRSLPPSRPGVRNFVYSLAPEALVKRGLADPPAYEATLRCVATRPVILAELPLQSGARAGRDSTQARMRWALPGEDGARTSILITAPLLQQTGLWGVSSVVSDVRKSGRGEVWLVNRTTGDVRRNGGYSLQSTRSAVVAGVILSWNQPGITPESIIRNGKMTFRDPQWAEHSTVVLVAEELVARFTAQVKSDRFEFRPGRWVE